MTALVVDASVWVSAADATDRFHAASRAFLAAAVGQRLALVVPAIAQLEVACALARRLRDAHGGRALADALLRSPLLRVAPLDAALLGLAAAKGTDAFLRAADALYAAAAEQSVAEIVSWDNELVERAGALTPDAWLARSKKQ